VCVLELSFYGYCSVSGHVCRLLPDHNIVRLSEYCIGIDYSSVIVEVTENLVRAGWSHICIHHLIAKKILN